MFSTKLVGRSAAHLQLLEKLSIVAPIDVEVLISGPTGVGKELYAHYLHEHSPRHRAAFVPINCGTLPNDLFENELFGHVGGAFTGARPHSEGLVAEAEHGTLFLDEVDSLSFPGQVKLLRFLQEKEYRRLGETRIRQAHVRVIAATNTDLQEAVQSGCFREDLFFRLHVFPVEVPSLRDRPEDIPLLLAEYVTRYAETYRLPKVAFSEAALRRLESYTWPGNIRELENCVKYLTCLHLDRSVTPDDLPPLVAKEEEPPAPVEIVATEQSFHEAKCSLVSNFEQRYLENALRQSGGNIAQAAQVSGKNRRAFFELMRKHGISATEYRSNPVSLDEYIMGRANTKGYPNVV